MSDPLSRILETAIEPPDPASARSAGITLAESAIQTRGIGGLRDVLRMVGLK